MRNDFIRYLPIPTAPRPEKDGRTLQTIIEDAAEIFMGVEIGVNGERRVRIVIVLNVLFHLFR
jgi:hypothetical protein